MTGRTTGGIGALVAAMLTATSMAQDGSTEPSAAEPSSPVAPASIDPVNADGTDVPDDAPDVLLIRHVVALPGGSVTARALTGFDPALEADAFPSLQRILTERSPSERTRRPSSAMMNGPALDSGSAPMTSILDAEPEGAESADHVGDRHTLGKDVGAIDRGESSRGLDLFRFTAEHVADGAGTSIVALAVESGFEVEFEDTRLDMGGEGLIGRYESAMQIPAPGAAALLVLGLMARRRRG